MLLLFFLLYSFVLLKILYTRQMIFVLLLKHPEELWQTILAHLPQTQLLQEFVCYRGHSKNFVFDLGPFWKVFSRVLMPLTPFSKYLLEETQHFLQVPR